MVQSSDDEAVHLAFSGLIWGNNPVASDDSVDEGEDWSETDTEGGDEQEDNRECEEGSEGEKVPKKSQKKPVKSNICLAVGRNVDWITT